jgi:hypothetical protein
MMALNEGYTYLHGNLVRGWEQKTTKDGKLLWENTLAYQPKKDDVTEWVRLTIWPSKEDSSDDSEGRAVADGSGKGTRVLVRGVLKKGGYTNKAGEAVTTWDLSTWAVGVVPRVPQGERRSDRPAAAAVPVYAADEEPF